MSLPFTSVRGVPIYYTHFQLLPRLSSDYIFLYIRRANYWMPNNCNMQPCHCGNNLIKDVRDLTSADRIWGECYGASRGMPITGEAWRFVDYGGSY